MAPVTELALIPLKTGISLDPKSQSGAILHDVMNTVSQQPGVQRIRYGLEVEAPTNWRLFIDWDRIEDHESFMKSDAYNPFMDKIGTIMDGKGVIKHVTYEPSPSDALNASAVPMTEIFTGYYQPDISESDRASNESDIGKFLDAIRSHAPGNGYRAHSGGWIVENVEYEGKEAKGYNVAVGWESKEAHMSFRDHEAFKNNIGLLRNTKGLLGLEMYHVKLEEYVAGGSAKPVQEEVLNPQAGEKKPPATTKDGMTTKYTR